MNTGETDHSSPNPWGTSTPILDTVPVSPELALIKSLDITKLKTVLLANNNYQYIIIDAPPVFNKITVSAMVDSDYLILSVKADLLSLNGGLFQLFGITNKEVK